MYYGDKRNSLVVIKRFLEFRGWKIYGFKEDMSDSMTDYFDPAYWKGIAVKNGYILVIDNYYSEGKIGGSFIHKSYDAKIANKIKKLVALRDNHAASKGEKANAQAIIEQLSLKVVEEVVADTNLPEVAYQKNPGHSKWHLEKGGKIIGKGTGVFGFSSLEYPYGSEKILYKEYDNNSPRDTHYYAAEDWSGHYESFLTEKKDRTKLLDKLEKLLNKWDNLAVIKIGNGQEETLVEKTITKKHIYFVVEESETPTEYIKVGSKWRRFGGLEKGLIYKIEDNNSMRKLTKKWKTLTDGSYVDTYKPEPRKSTKPQYCRAKEEDFTNKDIVYVKLVEKEEFEKQIVYVKSKAA